MLVETARHGPIAVLTLNSPPVNALSRALRSALMESLEAALADSAVQAIVIACAGRSFVAGADIAELDKPRIEPLTATLAARLEQSAKPTIAAIHGTALGGGLELAMGCHWRIAAKDSRLGLPEVKLGLIPGGGGTQRLPRLVGSKLALDMITGGEMISAEAALASGLVDELAAGDVREAAIAFAQRVLAGKRAIRRAGDLPPAKADAALFEYMRAELKKRKRGFEAPLDGVTAVEAASLPFEQGLARERGIFEARRLSGQFRALRHVFFAEREAAKLPDLPAGLATRDICQAAVIGAGTMGTGIAICFANAGIPVTLIEADASALARGLETIKRDYESSAKRRNLSPGDIEKRVALIQGSLELGAASTADLVIEAVFEELDLKRKIFAELDRFAKPGAILATNTSYQDVDAIAAATKRPEDVLGLHFFSPAAIMRLVEVARAKKTSLPAMAAGLEIARRLKKLPVAVKAAPGFVGNRMLAERSREADRLLMDGALPQDVDAAMLEFGFPMGPFAASDMAGLDVSWRARRAVGLRLNVADALAEAGRYGQKTSAGYFRYAAGSRVPEPDPEVEKLIAKLAGGKRRAISAAEIVERLIYPLVNEGARLLEEGVALRPGDIDVVQLYGYGFPAWRGGPMFYADEVGLGVIRDRLNHMARDSGEKALIPAPLLERRIKEGRGFYPKS
jgi:3-hydroxyacyl-CoA dehydrogenase